jgi:hypothetical protein
MVLRNHFININGLAQNPIGYRYTQVRLKKIVESIEPSLMLAGDLTTD